MILGFTPRPASHRGKIRAMSVGETHQVLQGNLAFHTHSTLRSVKMSLDLPSGVNYVKTAILSGLKQLENGTTQWILIQYCRI